MGFPMVFPTSRGKVRCLFQFLALSFAFGFESGTLMPARRHGQKYFFGDKAHFRPGRDLSCLKAMPELPTNVEKYNELPFLEPAFTAATIPGGLKKDHTTKAGTWGVIRVFQGSLEYIIDGKESFKLSSSYSGIIEPGVKHHVKALSDDVEFVVEFHREVDEE